MAKATSKPSLKPKRNPFRKNKVESEVAVPAEESKHVSGIKIDEHELKFLAERSGRICQTPGCSTRLRLSNPGKYCSPCLEGKTASAKRMRINAPVMEPAE